jgi:hypothetical protein
MKNIVFTVLNELKCFSKEDKHESDYLKALITNKTTEVRIKFEDSYVGRN